MNVYRKIIHLDLDAFFCSVEEQRDPTLKGKPFAVGGSPEGRGVVASCSYPARVFGIRSAMPMARALTLCPHLIVLSHTFSDYSKASKAVMQKLKELSEEFEQISIDEAFIDVTDRSESVEMIAHNLQVSIQRDLKLPCSLGVASNKLVAKIATDVGKIASKKNSPPNTITIVPPETEADFLDPLPVEMLWGIGPKTAARLAELNIHTIGELSKLPEESLVRKFGKVGHSLAKRSRGIDNRPLVTFRQVKSVSHERTFSKDVGDIAELISTIESQAARISKRLKKKGLVGRVIRLKLRWPDFTTLSRQTTVFLPTDDAKVIQTTAEHLLQRIWSPGKRVRLIGVGISGLDTMPRQLGLWDADVEKERKLLSAIGNIHQRFGKEILSRGIPIQQEDEHR